MQKAFTDEIFSLFSLRIKKKEIIKLYKSLALRLPGLSEDFLDYIVRDLDQRAVAVECAFGRFGVLGDWGVFISFE